MGGHVNLACEAPAKFQGRANKPGAIKIKGTELEIKISETIDPAIERVRPFKRVRHSPIVLRKTTSFETRETGRAGNVEKGLRALCSQP